MLRRGYESNLVYEKVQELELSKAINECLKQDYSKELMKITPSQWGGIRAYAENTSDIKELETQIFKNYITHGVAYERYWKKGGRISKLQGIFDENSKVVLILPDHGSRYMEKIYSDEWMKEQGFFDSEKQALAVVEYIK